MNQENFNFWKSNVLTNKALISFSALALIIAFSVPGNVSRVAKADNSEEASPSEEILSETELEVAFEQKDLPNEEVGGEVGENESESESEVVLEAKSEVGLAVIVEEEVKEDIFVEDPLEDLSPKRLVDDNDDNDENENLRRTGSAAGGGFLSAVGVKESGIERTEEVDGGSVTIVKEMTGYLGENWSFDFGGSWNFRLSHDNNSFTASNLERGRYLIEERQLPENWSLSDISCSPEDQVIKDQDNQTVYLYLTDDVKDISCTFTNHFEIIDDVQVPDNFCELDSGNVGTEDLLLLLSLWGPVDEDNPQSKAADLNKDNTVGVPDLLMLLSMFDKPCTLDQDGDNGDSNNGDNNGGTGDNGGESETITTGGGGGGGFLGGGDEGDGQVLGAFSSSSSSQDDLKNQILSLMTQVLSLIQSELAQIQPAVEATPLLAVSSVEGEVLGQSVEAQEAVEEVGEETEVLEEVTEVFSEQDEESEESGNKIWLWIALIIALIIILYVAFKRKW